MLNSLSNIRLFLQYHDMAHDSFFEKSFMNKLIGVFIGIYTHFPWNPWRERHNNHHHISGNSDKKDPQSSILVKQDY